MTGRVGTYMGSSIPGFRVSFLITGVFVGGLASLLYNTDLTVSLLLGSLAGLAMVLLMNNQQKNLKEWEKHPTTFPNQLGGGLVGEYMKRPWQQELVELGRVYGEKKASGERKMPKRKEDE